MLDCSFFRCCCRLPLLILRLKFNLLVLRGLSVLHSFRLMMMLFILLLLLLLVLELVMLLLLLRLLIVYSLTSATSAGYGSGWVSGNVAITSGDVLTSSRR